MERPIDLNNRFRGEIKPGVSITVMSEKIKSNRKAEFE
jgi:hypothetical protein